MSRARLALAQRRGVRGAFGVGSIEIVSGNSQSATAGQALPSPLIVRVRDQFGNPFPGRTVSAAVNSGGGGITPASAVTDSSGLASFTATVGVTAGFNSFTVSAAGLSGSPVVFTATGVGTLSPNLPNDMTLIGQFTGTVRESGGSAFGIPGFGPWQQFNGVPAANIAVVADPTNPTGSGFSLRFKWQDIYPEPRVGVAGSDFTPFGAPFRRMYIGMRLFFESDWVGIGTKFFYLGVPSTSSGLELYNTRDVNGDTKITNQGGSQVANNLIDVPNALVATSRWYHLEYLFTAESGFGVNDGRIQVWLDGVLIGDNGAVQLDDSRFNEIQYYVTSGSTGYGTAHYRIGQLTVAGGA